MSAEWELREAILKTLRTDAEIMAHVNGVFNERPLVATPPYIELLGSTSSDWSSKSFIGREVRISIALRSAAQEDAPSISVLPLIENLMLKLPNELPHHRIINNQYLRSRSGHDADGRWTIVLSYRFRLQGQ